jgi:hypothetical protein
MAIRYAVATGNWSSTATWNGGTLPTSADDVYANGFTVQVNQNVTVLSLNTTIALGVLNGGNFNFSAGGFTVVADTIQAGSGIVLTVGGSASGTYTITANTINGGITPNTATALFINSALSNVIINSNINAYAGGGIDAASCVSTTINGNVTANAGAIGINHRGPGTYTINGFCQGNVSNFGYGTSGSSILTIATITKAISINNGLPGVNSSASSVPSVTVKEIEQGVFGYVPISGYVRLSSASGAFYKGVTTGISTRTLSDPSDIAGQVPAQSDVRFGVTYQSGSKTGSAYIPSPSSVGFGVPVDNTTGTAALTPASVWDAATSSLTTSGSIGERLKNASTVDTTGDQLAALL